MFCGVAVTLLPRIPRTRWISTVDILLFFHVRSILGRRARKSAGAKDPLCAQWRDRAVRKDECKLIRSLISSGSSSARSMDISRVGQGLLVEIGGVSLQGKGDESLNEEAREDETVKASRKARTPLVGVSVCFARSGAFLRGTGGSDGLEALAIDDFSCRAVKVDFSSQAVKHITSFGGVSSSSIFRFFLRPSLKLDCPMSSRTLPIAPSLTPLGSPFPAFEIRPKVAMLCVRLEDDVLQLVTAEVLRFFNTGDMVATAN